MILVSIGKPAMHTSALAGALVNFPAGGLASELDKITDEFTDKIKSGEAADLDTFNSINRIPIVRPHDWFPSSYMRAQKDEPPPIYTMKDVQSNVVKNYYN